MLRTKLMATDIDQEVKESALECFGHLMACVGDLPAFQTPHRDYSGRHPLNSGCMPVSDERDSEYPWRIHGYLWIYMDVHEYPSMSIDVHGHLHRYPWMFIRGHHNIHGDQLSSIVLASS